VRAGLTGKLKAEITVLSKDVTTVPMKEKLLVV
jgi:hypothetical protein